MNNESIKPSVKIIEKQIPYALLQCTNLYPTPAKLIRLNDLNILKKVFPNLLLASQITLLTFIILWVR